MGVPKKVEIPRHEPGHRRQGWVELWGWSEVLKASERTDFALRYLRASYAEEWPEPVTVLAIGPVYVADECREFLKNHPLTPPRPELTEQAVTTLYQLHDHGVDAKQVAAVVECSVPTVYNYLKRRRESK